MKPISKGTLIFNAGGVLVGLVLVGYFVNSIFSSETAIPCSAEYQHAYRLGLERGPGELMTAPELQARLGGLDFGVADNTEILWRDAAAKRPVLQVALRKGSTRPDNARTENGGVDFSWRPKGITEAEMVCLSYDIWLPADFDFNRGGTLPGLYGAATEGDGEGEPVFQAPLVWKSAGNSGVAVVTRSESGKQISYVERGRVRIPRGRWVSIAQEIRLNTPGQKDGILRTWIDGSVAVDRKGLQLRREASDRFEGVKANVHYGGSDPSQAAPKDASVRISAFTVAVR